MQTQHQIQYKTTVNAPVEKVWAALTDPEIIKQYFFGTQLICDWAVGNAIVFQGEWEGQKYKDHGTVLEYEPNNKLAYSYLSSWSGMEDKPENYLRVAYELEAVGNQCALTISQSNYDEERAKHSEGNWEALMEAMKKVIE